MFIYVGDSHNLEKPQVRQGDTVRWMALRLRELTGLDPLTIDQTAGLPTGDAQRDDPVRRAVVAAHQPQVPSVLQDGQGQPVRVTPFQRNDLQVFHPDPVPVGGRPGWLSGGGRVPARVQVAGWADGGAGSCRPSLPGDLPMRCQQTSS